MTESIEKTQKSDEILQVLLKQPADLSAIEDLLKTNRYTVREISRAGYDYTEACKFDSWDYSHYRNHEFYYSQASFIPDILSSNAFRVIELLLKYGLDPNAVCDGNTIMHHAVYIENEYLAADILALLISHGGDPYREVGDNESLFDKTDFDIWYDAINLTNRKAFDSTVHCWMVLLGYHPNPEGLADVFSERRSDCELPEFKLEDLKEHRNYYYGLSSVPNRGEDWSIQIFDSRTRWEVLRL